jgi:hypothetical protein
LKHALLRREGGDVIAHIGDVKLFRSLVRSYSSAP